jgi:hypothetical protein
MSARDETREIPIEDEEAEPQASDEGEPEAVAT